MLRRWSVQVQESKTLKQTSHDRKVTRVGQARSPRLEKGPNVLNLDASVFAVSRNLYLVIVVVSLSFVSRVVVQPVVLFAEYCW